MELNEKHIGSMMTGKAKNGMIMTCEIKNDKRLFKLYKDLGFDVFKAKTKKSESTEGTN